MAIQPDNDEQASVWESLKFTMNFGDYNSMTVEFGQARKCQNTTRDITKTYAIIHKHNMHILEQRVQEMKDIKDEIDS